MSKINRLSKKLNWKIGVEKDNENSEVKVLQGDK